MKHSNKELEKNIIKQIKKKKEPLHEKIDIENIEEVQKLVHLLQVHQIELEQQNQELRTTQQELEVSRNKYVNLFDFSPIPYFTLDMDGMIKELNLSASKMLDIDRGKLIGKKLNTYIPLNEKDIFNSFIGTIFSSPVKHSCEVKVINKNQNIFNVLLEGLELENTMETDRKCQVALIDLTEYKRVEDSLKETNEELKILNNTKDKFFSIIAHDLRRPFQSLLGYSELLSAEIETLSREEIQQFSEGLNENLKNLFSLLENLLNWSMMQRNMIDYKPVKLNLFDAVNKIKAISNQNAAEKEITLSNIVDTKTFVYADVDMLSSIVENLVMNAIKFTSIGGQIVISSENKDSFVEVTVRDTGIGIESEKLSELFNFNTLFSTEGTAGEKGTGLGLPLCKEFVERNEGKIRVESELRKGSKFIFTLRKSI